MNILITGCFHSLNSGVMAMAEAIIQHHSEDVIYIYTSPRFFEIDKERYCIYPNVNVVIPPWYKGGSFFKPLQALTGLLCGGVYDMKFRVFLKQIDKAYDISGDSISSDYGLKSALLSLMPIVVSSRYVKQTIIAPQSVGPFNNFILKKAVKKVFSQVHKIFLRESISPLFLKPLGVPFEVVSDLANLVSPIEPINLNVVIDGNYVGVGVSSLLKKFGQNNSINYFHEIIEEILSSGYKVYLINHVSYEEKSDLSIAREIKHKFYSNDTRVVFFDENFRASEWKSIYSNSKAVISARMHPTVLALSSGTPALNLSYNHKSLGVVKIKYSPLGDVKKFNEEKDIKAVINRFLLDINSISDELSTFLVEQNKLAAQKVFINE